MEYRRPEMLPGEQLVWTAQPEAYRDYRKLDRVLLPVSAVLLGLSTLLAVYTLYSMKCYGFQPYHAVSLVILAILAAVSVYTFFFRFAVKRANKRRLVYGFTSEGRVLIRDMKTLDVYDFMGEDLEEAHVTDLDGRGVGTIYLSEKKHLFDNCGLRVLTGADTNFLALYDVANAEEVFAMITG